MILALCNTTLDTLILIHGFAYLLLAIPMDVPAIACAKQGGLYIPYLKTAVFVPVPAPLFLPFLFAVIEHRNGYIRRQQKE